MKRSRTDRKSSIRVQPGGGSQISRRGNTPGRAVKEAIKRRSSAPGPGRGFRVRQSFRGRRSH